MLAMTSGQVEFYNFITGDHIYALNTHQVFQFPNTKICEAIEMCARTYWYDLLLQNECHFHDSHSHESGEDCSDSSSDHSSDSEHHH